MADFNVSLGADMGPLIADLAKARADGKITATEYARGMKTIETSIKAADKLAQQLRKSTKDVGKDGKAAFDSLKNAAEGFGGKIGGSVAMVEKFGKAAAGIAGPLGPIAGVAVAGGLALAGLGVAATLAAEKLNAAMNAAVEFANKNADLIPPETLEALRDYDARSSAVANSLSTAGAVAAGELAPALDTVQRLLLKGGLIATDFADDVVRGMAMAADSIVLGLVPGLETTLKLLGIKLPSATAGAAKGLKLLDEATSGLDARVDALIGREYDKAEALRTSTEAGKEQVVVVEELTAAQISANHAFLDEILALVAAANAAAEHEAMVTAMVESVAKSRVQWSQWAADQEVAHRVVVQKATMAAAQSGFETIQNFGDLAIQNAQENDKISQKQANNRIRAAFAAQKVAAIAQAAIIGSEVFFKMVAYLASSTGPAAIPIAAAITGPLLASQVAVIAAQKAPTFAAGGLVGDRVDGDHVTIAASRDEAVLTGRGVSAIGGAAGVAAINAGRSSPTTIVVQLDRDVIARVVLDPANAKQIARAVAPHLRGRGM